MTAGLESAWWGAGDGWEAVRLEYAGGTLAMTVVLPERGSGSPTCPRRWPTEDWRGSSRRPAEAEVMLSLPRWTFRTQVSLRETLATLGMTAAFDERAADFQRHDAAGTALRLVGRCEAFIVVDEEGSEAAAATAVVMRTTSAPMLEHEVVVDRPFFFVVHDVAHLTPLFVGRVTDPTA